mmetsp:Transcript_62949/g.72224  ORF Transcript_62949/g.72224 Transcript_62949/m.72224 type:complete len:291 (-) Transcript_62949:422-1294(-)
MGCCQHKPFEYETNDPNSFPNRAVSRDYIVDTNRKTIEEFLAVIEASDNFDLDSLLQYLTSNRRIQVKASEKMHSWACNPESVGAFACLQLAHMAYNFDKSDCSQDDIRQDYQHFVSKLVRGRITFRLVKYLNSAEMDRMDAALILLGYLIENPKVLSSFKKYNGYSRVCSLIHSKENTPRRLAAVKILETYFYHNPELKAEFVLRGGAESLLHLLGECHEDDLSILLSFTEHLFLNDEEDFEVDIVRAFVKAGLYDTLGEVLKSEVYSDELKNDISTFVGLLKEQNKSA